ncbi:helix-turn-helix domain-containing protein [Mucilaginibacter gotjawali]|uniref:Excisionase family DNA binding protein n=2 Tax=Mucilaginibacter gotjawali TaxID=1550579 RepID=A0A839SGX4_9SPHI|nr:helix-turn-helix domain-containing protein [Mucilaginibacter gotjawali]MBB3055829.1 excisionase family DNA binding protein [Mucilaginibacter gotjawali]BAU54650.1 Helix-turn-helix domain protein [Mucilaginibacter gotjawali]
MKKVFKTTLSIEELSSLIKEAVQSVINNEQNQIAATDDEGFINFKQACEYLKLSRSTMYKLNMNNELPVHRKGKRLLFKKSELADWLKK